MHGVEGVAARLSVQVVALEEDAVVAEAAHVHAAVHGHLELHALADVEASLLAGRRPLQVGQRAQAEAILARRVEEAVDDDARVDRTHLEYVAHLKLALEVLNCAPAFRHCLLNGITITIQTFKTQPNEATKMHTWCVQVDLGKLFLQT